VIKERRREGRKGREDFKRARLCKLARVALSNHGKDAFSRQLGRRGKVSDDGS
jgi:hypothetical protein